MRKLYEIFQIQKFKKEYFRGNYAQIYGMLSVIRAVLKIEMSLFEGLAEIRVNSDERT